MIFEKAKQVDLPEVARLHVRAFPDFFLTSLGVPFLEELYGGFLAHSSGIFIVVHHEGRIVGFASGTSNPDDFFSDLRRRRKVAFVIKAIPAVMQNPLPVCKKLFSALRYRGEAPVSVKGPSGALLSSIGIDSAFKGSGLATELITAFEREAETHGAEYVYLTTDTHGNDRVNRFYNANGYIAVSMFLQGGKREMFRYEKHFRKLIQDGFVENT